MTSQKLDHAPDPLMELWRNRWRLRRMHRGELASNRLEVLSILDRLEYTNLDKRSMEDLLTAIDAEQTTRRTRFWTVMGAVAAIAAAVLSGVQLMCGSFVSTTPQQHVRLETPPRAPALPPGPSAPGVDVQSNGSNAEPASEKKR